MVEPHQNQVHPQQLPLVLDACKNCPQLCTGTLASSGYECHHMQHKHQKKVPKTVSILDIGVDHNDSSAPLASSADTSRHQQTPLASSAGTPDRGRDQKVSSLTAADPSCFTSLTPHPVINTHHHHTLCIDIHSSSSSQGAPDSSDNLQKVSPTAIYDICLLFNISKISSISPISFLEIRQC